MNIDPATITDDVAPTEDSLVESLMDRWTPKNDKGNEAATVTTDEDEGGYEAEGEPVDEDEDEDEPEGDDETPEGAAEDDKAKEAEGPTEIADDMIAKVTVDGQEIQLTGADLKRLAGQEAALTKKSQAADQLGTRSAMVLRGALEIAKEDLDEYEGVDWLVEKDRMDPEWFEYHRGRAAQAEARFNTLMGVAQAQMAEQAQRAEEVSAEHRAQATAAIKAKVPEWDDSRDAANVSYMIAQGLTEETARSLLDPVARILVDKARLYDEGKTKAAAKLAKAPEKTVQPGGATKAEVQTKAIQNASERLKGGKGSDEDAMAVLMGRWARKTR